VIRGAQAGAQDIFQLFAGRGWFSQARGAAAVLYDSCEVIFHKINMHTNFVTARRVIPADKRRWSL
jgi:hypothetical protein